MLYTCIASILYESEPVFFFFVCLFVLHVLYSVFYLQWGPWKVVHWEYQYNNSIQYNTIQFTCNYSKYYLVFNRVFVALRRKWTIVELLSMLYCLFSFACCSLTHLCLQKIQDAKERRIMVLGQFQDQQHFYFAIFLSAVICLHLSMGRSVWSYERSSPWWDRIVNKSFNEEDWLENCRMSRGTFLYLCAELKSLEKRDSAMRRAISLEQRVATALWRLATNDDYRAIAHLFGVSRASVCLLVR